MGRDIFTGKIFHIYRILGRGILTPRPFIQIHQGLVHPRPLQGVAVGFGQVVCGPREDHVRWHLPGPQEMGPASQGMGVNLQRPYLAGPQLYQPIPLLPFQKKMLKTSLQSHWMPGKTPPK